MNDKRFADRKRLVAGFLSGSIVSGMAFSRAGNAFPHAGRGRLELSRNFEARQ
jgi:hypothetical protein